MALTNAERQRRYRAHKAGNHKLCAPGCGAGRVARDVSAERNDVTRPPALGARGRRLWRQVTDGAMLKPTELVTLEEACRSADRLDVLDRILRGDQSTWLELVPVSLDGRIVEVRAGNVLTEVRQQQTTLARLLAELRQSRAGVAGNGRAATGPTKPPVKGAPNVPAGVGDLTARIAERRGQATG